MKLSTRKQQESALARVYREYGVVPETEAAFTKQVLAMARLYGWRTAHFRPAQTQTGRWLTPVQGDGKGFPDLIMVRGEVLLTSELKVGKNKLTPEQIAWLSAFERVGRLEVHTWRPEDWQRINRVLADGGSR